MKKQTIISTISGLMLLAFALTYAFEPGPEQEQSRLPESTPVHVEAISKEVSSREVRFSAITRPVRHAVLSFTRPARMVERPVEVGDGVETGQVLASLDVREFDNGLAQAQAAVAELEVRLGQARRDHLRYSRLNQSKAVPKQKAEQATSLYFQLEATISGARAKLAETKRQRDEAVLKAPFSGSITGVYLEPGEWTLPGHPIVELVDDNGFELEVEVPETVIGHLQTGQQVDINLPFLKNTKITGEISHMARASVSAGRLFPVVVRLDPNPKLLAGITAELILKVESRSTFLVPVAAVINPGGSRPSLFILNGNRVHEVFIELNSFKEDKVSVWGDLSSNDKVVVQGQTFLTDGKEVKVDS